MGHAEFLVCAMLLRPAMHAVHHPATATTQLVLRASLSCPTSEQVWARCAMATLKAGSHTYAYLPAVTFIYCVVTWLNEWQSYLYHSNSYDWYELSPAA